MTKTAQNNLRSRFAEKFGILALAGGLLFGPMARAQTDTAASFNLYEVGTSDFSKAGTTSDSLTSVSSLIPLTPQESPGSITIFSSDEIKKIGARDLLDLLNLVPGFYFSGDIEGTINPGVRGNIAQEAILLMVDGVEMNELMYGSTPMIGRFPMDQIEKVEVIRGPGSAVLGGFATYAVINVTTRAGANENGFNISNSYGRALSGESRQGASINIGTSGHGWKAGMVGSLSKSIAGVGSYKDHQGSCFNMAKNNTVSDKFVSSYFDYKGLTFRYLANSYHTKNRDSYKTISFEDHSVDFGNHDLQLRYRIKIGPKSEIVPQASFTRQSPWQTPEPTYEQDSNTIYMYHRVAQRLSAGAILNTAPSDNFKFSLGVNHRFDKAINKTPDYPFYNDQNTMKFNIVSIYTQILARTRAANVILGGRLEKHNRFNPAFAPRVALSRRIGKVSAKVGYTRSYKMPTFENFNLSDNQNIKPQYTSSIEGELQYTIANRVEAFVNAFKIDTKSGIAYVLGDEYAEGYDNCGDFATKGSEAGLRARFSRFDLSGAYSFYTNRNENTFKNYRVPGQNLNLAFPAHKLSFNGNVVLGRNCHLNANLIYLSSRFSYDIDSSGGNAVYFKHPSVLIVNLFATARIPIGYGLEAGFGVKDVFNSGITYIQPYASFHRPLPGIGREFQVRLTYELTNR